MNSQSKGTPPLPHTHALWGERHMRPGPAPERQPRRSGLAAQAVSDMMRGSGGIFAWLWLAVGTGPPAPTTDGPLRLTLARAVRFSGRGITSRCRPSASRAAVLPLAACRAASGRR